MDKSFETKLKEVLEHTEDLKTPDCPDATTIGLYIEGELPKAEAIRTEKHISSCLHCLDQVLELRELLYYQSKWTQVSDHLLKKLGTFYFENKRSERKSFYGFINAFITWIAVLFSFPFRQWRYAIVSVVSICLTLAISMNLADRNRETTGLPELNPHAFVNVSALGSSGNIIKETQGVVVDAQGTVATSLSPLVGATSVQITLRDGKTFQIKSLWKDDGKNLAMMKIEGVSLPSFKTTDSQQINIGEKAFVVTDTAQSKKGVYQVVISDLKSYAGRHGAAGVQYIQLASFSAQYTKGALIDKNGNLIGLLITGEKNIHFAAPLKDAYRLISEQKPMPVSELKNVSYSADALGLYFKGILARNAQIWDEAIELFKKAVELNPNLEDAHLELGFLYYKKRIFDLEKKEYEAALKINPANTDTMFYLATNMETMGQYSKAVEVYEKIVTLDPQDADAYYELGLAYLAQGEKDKAMNVYAALKNIDAGLAGKLKMLIK
jgi:tetratricopeptide (TPR) repeat protein